MEAQIQSEDLTVGAFFVPADRLEVERYQSMCRAQLGEAGFEPTRSEGRTLTLKQAIDLALSLEAEMLKEDTFTSI